MIPDGAQSCYFYFLTLLLKFLIWVLPVYHAEDGFIISCRQWKCNQNFSKLEGPKRPYPILLLNGYSTESYWLPTEPIDLIRTLLEEGHEVWLLQPRLHPLTLQITSQLKILEDLMSLLVKNSETYPT